MASSRLTTSGAQRLLRRSQVSSRWCASSSYFQRPKMTTDCRLESLTSRSFESGSKASSTLQLLNPLRLRARVTYWLGLYEHWGEQDNGRKPCASFSRKLEPVSGKSMGCGNP